MIGDRIYTDMAMAHAAGDSILVLTGEASREDLGELEIVPSLVVESVDALLR